MGCCAACSRLAEAWRASAAANGSARRRAVELPAYPPRAPQQGGYHRVTGLHYTSSFSEADDCCHDSGSGGGSSLASDGQASEVED